jgi:uncharacterized membrane protein
MTVSTCWTFLWDHEWDMQMVAYISSKTMVFWIVMLYSSENILPPISRSKWESNNKRAEQVYKLTLVFHLLLLISCLSHTLTWRWRRCITQKRQVVRFSLNHMSSQHKRLYTLRILTTMRPTNNLYPGLEMG